MSKLYCTMFFKYLPYRIVFTETRFNVGSPIRHQNERLTTMGLKVNVSSKKLSLKPSVVTIHFQILANGVEKGKKNS